QVKVGTKPAEQERDSCVLQRVVAPDCRDVFPNHASSIQTRPGALVLSQPCHADAHDLGNADVYGLSLVAAQRLDLDRAGARPQGRLSGVDADLQVGHLVAWRPGGTGQV